MAGAGALLAGVRSVGAHDTSGSAWWLALCTDASIRLCVNRSSEHTLQPDEAGRIVGITEGVAYLRPSVLASYVALRITHVGEA